MTFITTPLNIYMVEILNAEPQDQNVINILINLPWSIKLLFGFLSDAMPIFGMRRKPYLVLGFFLQAAPFIAYAIADIQTIDFLAICIFVGTIGLIMMDVMCDTMVVERSKFEEDANLGQMQASCYSFRFGGSLVGSFLGAILTNESSWGWGMSFQQIIFLNGILPVLLMTPWLFCLREKYHKQNELSAIRVLELAPLSPPVDRDKIIEGAFTPVPKSTTTTALVRNPSFRDYQATGMAHKALMRSDSFAEFAELPKKDVNTNNEREDVNTNNKREDKQGHEQVATSSMISNRDNGDTSVESIQQSDENDKVGSANNKSISMNLLRMDSFMEAKEGPLDLHTGAPLSGDEILEILDEELDTTDEPPPISKQIEEIWETCQLEAVWRPMAFVYIFNVLQIPNVAWQSYLQLTLNFPAWILGLDVFLGAVMTFAGILAYKFYFFGVPWKDIYFWSVIFTAFFSMMQMILVFQLNTYINVSNYVFSLGDDSINQLLQGIQFLPVCIMYMRLCPEGAEGASYSMLTTFNNIAGSVAYDLGNVVSQIWYFKFSEIYLPSLTNFKIIAHLNFSCFYHLPCLSFFLGMYPMVL